MNYMKIECKDCNSIGYASIPIKIEGTTCVQCGGSNLDFSPCVGTPPEVPTGHVEIESVGSPGYGAPRSISPIDTSTSPFAMPFIGEPVSEPEEQWAFNWTGISSTCDLNHLLSRGWSILPERTFKIKESSILFILTRPIRVKESDIENLT